MNSKKLEKKTKKVLEDFEGEKRKHLEKQANKILKKDKKFQQLKNVVIDDSIFDLF